MTKLEIYAHESLEKPLLKALVPVPPDAHDPEGRSGRAYSLIRQVAGRGFSGTSMGDDIWPESNIKMELFVEEDELEELRAAIGLIRSTYPKLGLAVFVRDGFRDFNS